MYNSNQCSGFFVKHQKQNQQKELKIYYFYVDIEGTMYYMHNMAYLNFLLRNSQSEHELVSRLRSSNFINHLSVQDCRISGIKSFPQLDHIPFHQRACFELHATNANGVKQMYIFSHIEEDIELLQEYLKGGWQKKRQEQRVQEVHDNEIYKKVQLAEKIQRIFEITKTIPVQILHDQKELHQEEITYTGQIVNEKPDGTGTLFFKNEGISFTGEFKEGKKHGSGYIVDSYLEMIYCEVINDELSGI